MKSCSISEGVWQLLTEIKAFGKGIIIFPQLDNEQWMVDLALMADITTHLSTLKRIIQGEDKLCPKLCSTVSGFITQLNLWTTQIRHGTFTHFPSLSEHRDIG